MYVPSVAVSSPVPGASSGSSIVVEMMMSSMLVVCTPSTVLVPSMLR